MGSSLPSVDGVMERRRISSFVRPVKLANSVPYTLPESAPSSKRSSISSLTLPPQPEKSRRLQVIVALKSVGKSLLTIVDVPFSVIIVLPEIRIVVGGSLWGG